MTHQTISASRTQTAMSATLPLTPARCAPLINQPAQVVSKGQGQQHQKVLASEATVVVQRRRCRAQGRPQLQQHPAHGACAWPGGAGSAEAAQHPSWPPPAQRALPAEELWSGPRLRLSSSPALRSRTGHQKAESPLLGSQLELRHEWCQNRHGALPQRSAATAMNAASMLRRKRSHSHSF